MAEINIKKITYNFGDSSVPPEYHRSYTIIVADGIVKIIIDSYGNKLAEKKYKISNRQFNDIKASLKRNGIGNCTLKTNDGCAGGTSESISYSNGDNEIFSGSVYHCGGKDSGNLCGDVAGFAKDVKNLVPDLEYLLHKKWRLWRKIKAKVIYNNRWLFRNW